jgi:hypothetical protein
MAGFWRWPESFTRLTPEFLGAYAGGIGTGFLIGSFYGRGGQHPGLVFFPCWGLILWGQVVTRQAQRQPAEEVRRTPAAGPLTMAAILFCLAIGVLDLASRIPLAGRDSAH